MIVEGPESYICLVGDFCDRSRRDTLCGEDAASGLDQLAAGLQLAPSAARDPVATPSAVGVVTGFFIELRHRSSPFDRLHMSDGHSRRCLPTTRRTARPLRIQAEAADGKPGAEIVCVHVFLRMLRAHCA